MLWGIYVLLVLGIDASLIGLQCYTVFKLYHGVKVDDFGFWILDFHTRFSSLHLVYLSGRNIFFKLCLSVSSTKKGLLFAFC